MTIFLDILALAILLAPWPWFIVTVIRQIDACDRRKAERNARGFEVIVPMKVKR